jgi:hypothetical protein
MLRSGDRLRIAQVNMSEIRLNYSPGVLNRVSCRN